MPGIFKYKCSNCSFALQTGWGYYFYVENDKGERIPCYHPAERWCVAEVLGKKASLKLIRERTGFNSFCLCLDCLHQFKADLGEVGWSPYESSFRGHIARIKQEKDKRECPSCYSKNVKTELEMVGENCPKCKTGVIKEKWTGNMS